MMVGEFYLTRTVKLSVTHPLYFINLLTNQNKNLQYVIRYKYPWLRRQPYLVNSRGCFTQIYLFRQDFFCCDMYFISHAGFGDFIISVSLLANFFLPSAPYRLLPSRFEHRLKKAGL